MRKKTEAANMNLRDGDSEFKAKKTIEEVVAEIKKTIDIDLEQETKLTRLRNKGFEVEHCWVKNGSIGDIYFMKQKNVYRIQVSESELHGKFSKAYCVIIPANQILFQSGDASRVRNYPIQHKSNSGTSNPEKKIVRYTLKSDTSNSEKIIVKLKNLN